MKRLVENAILIAVLVPYALYARLRGRRATWSGEGARRA